MRTTLRSPKLLRTEVLAGTLAENITLFARRPRAELEAVVAELGMSEWVAGLPDAQWGMPALIHAQTLALQASLARGLTPDNPFPGGEVNRVVKGVTIHPWQR